MQGEINQKGRSFYAGITSLLNMMIQKEMMEYPYFYKNKGLK